MPASSEGLSFGAPERKMGLTGSTTTLVNYDRVRVPAANLIGAEGDGMRIALSALDSGRLGIAACATGLAQAALDVAASYALERQQFGHRDRGLPGRPVPARRHGRRGRVGPVDVPAGGPAA